LFKKLTPFNFLQTMISSDYLIMKELKSECMSYFVVHITRLLTKAFNIDDSKNEFPIDQLEDYLIEELAGRIQLNTEATASLI